MQIWRRTYRIRTCVATGRPERISILFRSPRSSPPEMNVEIDRGGCGRQPIIAWPRPNAFLLVSI